jgi:hypothetical protein
MTDSFRLVSKNDFTQDLCFLNIVFKVLMKLLYWEYCRDLEWLVLGKCLSVPINPIHEKV